MCGYSISDEELEKATQDILSYIENTPVDALVKELETDKIRAIAYGVLEEMDILSHLCNDPGIYLKNEDSGEYEKVTVDFFDFLLSDNFDVAPTTPAHINSQKRVRLNISKIEKFVP